mmetsp:Transcript_20285/g.53353  ORF Transcript_20285/g.53353 Transcript_20285/m.53353 type:complete len:305 (+) Transcript_20285:79-993(+)
MLALAVACAASTADIVTKYEIIVDSHISTIMPLFLSDELNHEWNQRMLSQRLIQTREFGQLVWQEYQLPWPLANRDLLMQCDRNIDHRSQRITSACKSVEHEKAPLSEHNVRLQLKRTMWEITPLPGDRTHLALRLELPASATHGLPKFVINYCQRQSLKDSVGELLAAAERLRLPVHESFVSWGRSRDVARQHLRVARADRARSVTTPSWLVVASSLYSYVGATLSASAALALGLALVLLQGGCLGLYCAYRRAHNKARGSGDSSWRAPAEEEEEEQQARWRRVRRCLLKLAHQVAAERDVSR